MGKDLSEMTLEELWELFPIFLVAHDGQWEDSFNRCTKRSGGAFEPLTFWAEIHFQLQSGFLLIKGDSSPKL